MCSAHLRAVHTEMMGAAVTQNNDRPEIIATLGKDLPSPGCWLAATAAIK
jgi:hypothetical protein